MHEDLDLPDALEDLADMHQRVTFMIFGAIITATRAFKSVGIKIHPDAQFIIAKIKLKSFWEHRIFKPLRAIWLARAEDAAKPHTPTGWRLVICYDRQAGK